MTSCMLIAGKLKLSLPEVLAPSGGLYVLQDNTVSTVAWDAFLDVYASKGFLKTKQHREVAVAIFGVDAATLCLFGAAEDKDVMWEAFWRAGCRGWTFKFHFDDGTCSNTAAMFRPLMAWGGDDLPSISLSAGASAMRKLWPQSSWEHTCTAATAIGLLSEMHHLPELSSYDLDRNAKVVEDSLLVLLEALTTRCHDLSLRK